MNNVNNVDFEVSYVDEANNRHTYKGTAEYAEFKVESVEDYLDWNNWNRPEKTKHDMCLNMKDFRAVYTVSEHKARSVLRTAEVEVVKLTTAEIETARGLAGAAVDAEFEIVVRRDLESYRDKTFIVFKWEEK